MFRIFGVKDDECSVPSEWKEKYEVKVYESDNLARGGVVTLFNYFQNTAWSHYNRVDRIRGPFLSKNQIWAMTRVEMQFNRPAKWQEIVEVETWSRGLEKMTAFRDFIIRDAANDIIAAGTATWVVIDIETKRIQRLTEIAEKWPSKPEVFSIHKNADRVDPPLAPEFGEPFRIKYSDMDLNHHVNSSRYIQWMLDSLGREFLEEHEVSKAEINYIDEAIPGEEVLTGSQKTSDEPPILVMNVLRKGDSKEVCRARFTF